MGSEDAAASREFSATRGSHPPSLPVLLIFDLRSGLWPLLSDLCPLFFEGQKKDETGEIPGGEATAALTQLPQTMLQNSSPGRTHLIAAAGSNQKKGMFAEAGAGMMVAQTDEHGAAVGE